MRLKDITLDNRNANKGTAKGQKQIIGSIQRNGFGRSGLLDKNGKAIAGNKTTEAAAEVFGVEVEPIIVQTDGKRPVYVQRTDLDLDDPDPNNAARRLAYEDNLASHFSFSLDPAIVMADIEAGFNFEAIDISLPDLGEMLEGAARELLRGNGKDAEPQIDKAAELQKVWNTAVGQIWTLGNHRLAIGDCTDRAVVEAVMRGEVFRLCATSPPYTDQREYKTGDFDWLGLANGFIDCAFAFADKDADVLVNLGLSHKNGRVDRYWDKWLGHCEETHPLYGWYVWDKGPGFPGEWNGRLAPAHEWVFHFSLGHTSANKWVETTGRDETTGKRFRQKNGSLKEASSPDRYGQAMKIPDSVIRIYSEKTRGIHTQAHPAVFSVEFAEFFVNTWSMVDDIIYDPFGGSGTTIIAAENLSRRCRAIELDPGYAAVTLQRFFDATGQTPKLLTE